MPKSQEPATVHWLDASLLLAFRGRPMSVGLIETKVPANVSNIKCYLMNNKITLV